jgi:gag-polypeptide of LTR copia-type
LLKCYGLFHYLISPPPPPTTISPEGQSQINPTYLDWNKQDQMILGWLRSSISEAILAQVVSCSTSNQLWSHLQQTFSATSYAHQTELRRQLQTLTKGGSSYFDFLQKL